MESRILPLYWLVDYFESHRRRGRILFVGIDGRGGSGKTSLATRLAGLSTEISVVSLNDFYVPLELRPNTDPDQQTSVNDTDWRRLFDEVLVPLGSFRAAKYKRRGTGNAPANEDVVVHPRGVVVVEGVGALCHEVRTGWDVRMWMSCPRSIRIARGMQRDGESMKNTWTGLWLPAGDRYETLHQPRECAHLIIDSSGLGEYDVDTEFVLLEERPCLSITDTKQ